MIQRRPFLSSVGTVLAGLFGMPGWALPRPLAVQPVATPAPMAQIAAGGPTGLLGVSVGGHLFALSLSPGGSARLLGENLDASSPLAIGHGRVAARLRNGALWVLQDGRAATSHERSLAPAAGLLVLPLAVIGIADNGGVHQVVRMELTGSGSWELVARSQTAVLPDARPLQIDLEGSGDAGHVVVLAGPDSERYRHGVLGDSVEATRLVFLERHDLSVMRELVHAAPHVFEDIAPRKIVLGSPLAGGGGGLREGVLTVQSGPLGAQLVVVGADPASPDQLRILASGPPLGTAHRWLAPITDGRRWLAVHTPHIGGVLHVYRQEGARLIARRLHGDVSNHRMGSRLLNISSWLGQRLLIPDQSGRRLLVMDAAADWRITAEHRFETRVAALVGLGTAERVAVLMEDGSVAVVT